ncbi:MAG: hypothetical protein SOV62_02940 [Alloprevotella sp.]|nr:hypothetical protein [Alloprevotella sp.]
MLLNFTLSKRYVAFVFAVAMSLTQMVVAQQQPAVGDGTSAFPFHISNAAELAWFRDYVNGTYTPADGETATTHQKACAILIDNIDLSSVCSATSGISWTPINSYNGTFNGNHKTIANLYINASTDNVGFFSKLYIDACVNDITFTGVDITNTQRNTGTLAGYLGESQNISGIKVESGTVKSSFSETGGIVGYTATAKLTDCTNLASVTGSVYTGGICGYALYSSVFSNCANYGSVTGEGSNTGGIAGYITYSSSLTQCANYGDIIGSRNIGGLCGMASTSVQLTDVASLGNVSGRNSDNSSGLLIGCISDGMTLSGHCFFNTEATLKNDNVAIAAVAIGSGSEGTTGTVTAYTAEQLQNGAVTWWLQNQCGVTMWGQNLGVDNYPVLGSTSQVYATGSIEWDCMTGYVSGGTFANTASETPATITLTHTHGTALYHEAVAATCTTDGNVAYWECSLCHKAYADEELTTAIADPVIPGEHQYGDDGVCTVCGASKYPSLYFGDNVIQIAAVEGYDDELSGYNLYRFVAPGTGRMTVETVGGEDTYGTLWNSDGTELLTEDDDEGDRSNFKFGYSVTAGTTYLIGVREYDGEEIPGDYTIKISGDWPVTFDAMTLTDAEAYEQPSVDGIPVVTNLTYKRNFTHTKWQPLYVPFAIKSSEVQPQGIELACINNFHEYEDADGNNKVVLEIKKVTSGVLLPNIPYLIRATEAGEKNITMANVVLEQADETIKTCSSMTRYYDFCGTYQTLSADDMDPIDDYYTMTEGMLYHPEGTLSAQRWYLHTEDREAIIDAESSEAPRSIEVRVIGEGEVTAIEDINFITTPATDKAEGLYDLQGRRLNAEPTHGVYVKNGQKTIK